MTQDEAITGITERAKARNQELSFTDLDFYVEKITIDILSYCKRSDFPPQLLLVAVELLHKFIAECVRLQGLADDGTPANLKKLKQNETEFTFAISDTVEYGTLYDKYFNTIKAQLNLYRKVYFK